MVLSMKDYLILIRDDSIVPLDSASTKWSVFITMSEFKSWRVEFYCTSHFIVIWPRTGNKYFFCSWPLNKIIFSVLMFARVINFPIQICTCISWQKSRDEPIFNVNRSCKARLCLFEFHYRLLFYYGWRGNVYYQLARFGILELRNRVAQDGVTLRVTYSKIFIEILFLSH